MILKSLTFFTQNPRNSFKHLGLEMAQQSIAVIEESTKVQSKLVKKIKRGEVGINPYFTVFRNPQVSRDRWKTEMPKEDQMRVMEIVKDTEVFAIGAEKGLW